MGKKTTIILLIFIILFFITYLFIGFKIIYSRNPFFKESYDQKNIKGIINSLSMDTDPVIEGISYLGLKDAPLSIIVIVDFKSELAKNFYNEKIGELKKNYVDTGQAKLYHKYYITKSEMDGKTGRFLYAAASRCYDEFTSEKTIEFNQALFNTSEDGIFSLAGDFNIPTEDFEKCVKEKNFQELSEDMLETEQFLIQSPSIYLGIDGGDNELIFGNPNIDFINKRMHFKQIKVGI